MIIHTLTCRWLSLLKNPQTGPYFTMCIISFLWFYTIYSSLHTKLYIHMWFYLTTMSIGFNLWICFENFNMPLSRFLIGFLLISNLNVFKFSNSCSWPILYYKTGLLKINTNILTSLICTPLSWLDIIGYTIRLNHVKV